MILFACNAIWWAVFGVGLYLVAAVLWHVSAPVRALIAACVEHGDREDDEACPDCPDPTAGWDRGHDEYVDRAVGL